MKLGMKVRCINSNAILRASKSINIETPSWITLCSEFAYQSVQLVGKDA